MNKAARQYESDMAGILFSQACLTHRCDLDGHGADGASSDTIKKHGGPDAQETSKEADRAPEAQAEPLHEADRPAVSLHRLLRPLHSRRVPGKRQTQAAVRQGALQLGDLQAAKPCSIVVSASTHAAHLNNLFFKDLNSPRRSPTPRKNVTMSLIVTPR